jgi:RNA polymerase sigma-70 factor (ECF subfamily)
VAIAVIFSLLLASGYKLKNIFSCRQPTSERVRAVDANILLVNSEYDEQLAALIQACMKGDKNSQKALYKSFYGYAMSICIRYSMNREEATEVMNDGFLKVFTKLGKYDPSRSFKGWIRKIMINTALDNYRHNLKHYYQQDLETSPQIPASDDVMADLGYQEIVLLVQKLSPAYRTVFNLYVMDGYTHEEIAEILDISTGTSKSNLFKAREHLKVLLKKNKDEYARYSG